MIQSYEILLTMKILSTDLKVVALIIPRYLVLLRGIFDFIQDIYISSKYIAIYTWISTYFENVFKY